MQNRSALVAYGSETGNAYDYADEVGRILERIHFWTHVSKLDAIDTASRQTNKEGNTQMHKLIQASHH